MGRVGKSDPRRQNSEPRKPDDDLFFGYRFHHSRPSKKIIFYYYCILIKYFQGVSARFWEKGFNARWH